jgi:hypothetical protein
MCLINLHTKFKKPNYSGSLLIAIKLKVEYRFHSYFLVHFTKKALKTWHIL